MNNKSLEKVIKYTELFDKYGNLLTQNQQQVFKLYYEQDLSYAEVAEVMATSRQAATDAVNKAIHNLLKIEEKMNKM
ncbi:sigma factor-like helix-turn-helix DNA-binding protein [Mycoplasma sp. 2704]|uniref:sigma factor-like helix-turn-helix DNA-binding protein n=1 Tax=unclassified Mycoplasma TaxID=2683645 RepID=UPI002B1D27CF|nr:sigma factor-like helix-turn-helix DNA-binding protein [Mycoplasma sp. 2704]MEA4134512.1 sigma factor-like helix-turn-helix DNA-binding protein [Mycoplasma sp. 2704]